MSNTFIFNDKKTGEILNRFLSGDILNQIISHEFRNKISDIHLTTFFQEVFWASILTEERNHHLLSVALSPSEPLLERGMDEKTTFKFKKSEKFNAKILAKLSPALENTNHHLGVWVDKDSELEIWGFTTDSKIVANVVEVGQVLVVGEVFETGKPIRKEKIAIDYSEINFIEDIQIPNLSDEIKSLALEMRKHKHGGTLLVIDGNKFKDYGIIDSALYFDTPKSITIEIDHLSMEAKKAFSRRNSENQDKNFALLSRLTAPDGATIINDKLEVIAFGAKLKPNSEESNENIDISLSKPFENFEIDPDKNKISKLGGTRHQSAARFIYDLKDNSLAIVASSEGKISIVYWEEEAQEIRVIQHAEYMFL